MTHDRLCLECGHRGPHDSQRGQCRTTGCDCDGPTYEQEPEYSVQGDWLVEGTGECIGGGCLIGGAGHEPGCGYEPVARISDLLRMAEEHEALLEKVLRANQHGLTIGEAWERALERAERHGPCICNTGPGTEGPDEFCPQHGRPYSEVLEMLSKAPQVEIKRERGAPTTATIWVEGRPVFDGVDWSAVVKEARPEPEPRGISEPVMHYAEFVSTLETYGPVSTDDPVKVTCSVCEQRLRAREQGVSGG